MGLDFVHMTVDTCHACLGLQLNLPNQERESQIHGEVANAAISCSADQGGYPRVPAFNWPFNDFNASEGSNPSLEHSILNLGD